MRGRGERKRRMMWKKPEHGNKQTPQYCETNDWRENIILKKATTLSFVVCSKRKLIWETDSIKPSF